MALIFLLLLLCSSSTLANLKPAYEIPPGLENKFIGQELVKAWEHFKHFFERSFESFSDELSAFYNFARNFFIVNDNNMKYIRGESSFEMQMNNYSDWSEDDMKKLRGFRPDLDKNQNKESVFLQHAHAPPYKNWVDEGAVSSVKNQGHCGSCWAFSSAGAIEGAYYLKTGKLVDLSEQQLVDCSSAYDDHGCNGGLMANAFQYIKDTGGITLNKTYPYISGDEPEPIYSCHADVADEFKVKISGYQTVQPKEEQLKLALSTHGPVSIAIDASQPSFRQYHRGIYSDPQCSPTMLDHAVLAVGYGTDETTGLNYWLVKNSWSPEWGDRGYFKLLRGSNMCGVATMAVYPVL